jgi:hypothetical protein
MEITKSILLVELADQGSGAEAIGSDKGLPVTGGSSSPFPSLVLSQCGEEVQNRCVLSARRPVARKASC